ncbi:MAG TPA: sulfatase [bacterium]|nr:sulfatase [bacterium]
MKTEHPLGRYLPLVFCLGCLTATTIMLAAAYPSQAAHRYFAQGLFVNGMTYFDLRGWLIDVLVALPLFTLAVELGIRGRRLAARRERRAFWWKSGLTAAAIALTLALYIVKDRVFGLNIAVGMMAAAMFFIVLSARPRPAGDRRYLRWLPLVIAALSLLPAGAASWFRVRHGKPTGAPNVILISIDTLRADHLSCYGHPQNLTPNIDAFAREGVTFANTIAQSSWTLPSHASMLTGYLPSSIGVFHESFPLRESVTTLAELLREQGYATVSFNGGVLLDAHFGFAQGFDRYWSFDGNNNPNNPNSMNDLASILNKTRRNLPTLKGKKFFLFFHTYQLHDPYNFHPGISEPGAAKCSDSEQNIPECLLAYEGEVRYVDRQMGTLFQLLRENGLLDNSLIIFTSDHGESFLRDKHHHTGHAIYLYDELIKVPLIVRFPGGEHAGRAIGAQVRLLDLVPTILDFVQARRFPGEGKSLLPLIAGTETKDRHSLSEYYKNPHLKIKNLTRFSLRTPEAKLIVNQRRTENEFFDLQRDPGELDNLLAQPTDDEQARANELMHRLTTLRAGRRLLAADLDPTNAKQMREVPPELYKQLKALGYVQ